MNMLRLMFIAVALRLVLSAPKKDPKKRPEELKKKIPLTFLHIYGALQSSSLRQRNSNS